MKIKKRRESVYSSIDLGLNSILTYATFVIIQQNLGIDLVGYFGLVLSISAIGETIQQGLYENPLFLNYGVGFKNFKLNIFNLALIILMPLLAVDRFLLEGLIFPSFLYAVSHVLIHNIRIFDYKNNNVLTAAKRSLVISILQIILFGYLLNNQNLITLEIIFYGIAVTRFPLIIINRSKIFFYSETIGNDKNLSFLISSILTIVRSRLPLWLLLPFGLGLVGIYETFRTLMEIYLTPSRPINLILLKNLKRDGSSNILKIGLLCALFSSAGIAITYFLLLNINVYSLKELNSIYPYLSLIFIIFSYWLSEVTGMIFQSNGYLDFEVMRRFSSLLIFTLIGLILYKFLNFNLFLVLVSSIYIFEVIFSLINFRKLKLGE